MDTAVPAEVVLKALRKIVAAIEGLGHRPVAIGAIARQAWGSKRAAQGIELLIATGEAQREALLSGARGEGMQQVPGGAPLSFRFTDAKFGGATSVDLVEATTPLHQKAIARAKQAPVLQMLMRVATCEDLILLAAGSTLPADRESVVELLRDNAGRIDAPYIKQEAEAAGIFDKVKSAWQEAKQKA